MASESNIALRNYAGIPVVELVGEINKTMVLNLEDILGKLVRAGHYNVMLNMKRAGWQNLNALKTLEKLAKTLQKHYGNLDVIAEMEQINLIRGNAPASMSNLLGFCTSEGQALARIRRLPVPSVYDVTPMSARLTES